MAIITQNYSNEWNQATKICRKFPNLKCLETTAALVKKFPDCAHVLYVCTETVAARPYICHVSFPDDVASETGKHWAVELHNKIFDNLHPGGESLAKWLRNYEYASIDFRTANFSEEIIQRWSTKEFLQYLKRCGRTPLGAIKKLRI